MLTLTDDSHDLIDSRDGFKVLAQVMDDSEPGKLYVIGSVDDRADERRKSQFLLWNAETCEIERSSTEISWNEARALMSALEVIT